MAAQTQQRINQNIESNQTAHNFAKPLKLSSHELHNRPNGQELSHAARDFRQPKIRSENCQA